jgi:hypothetical protein
MAQVTAADARAREAASVVRLDRVKEAEPIAIDGFTQRHQFAQGLGAAVATASQVDDLNPAEG